MMDENSRWDEQIDNDSASGKIDFLFKQVPEEAASGLLREWPIPTIEKPPTI